MVTLFTSRIVEDSLLNQRVNQRMQEVNDFSVNVSGPLSRTDAESLYESAIAQGRDISGRVLIVNESGIVQIDSFSVLNGAQITSREVVEVLSGEKDASFGYHWIQSESGEDFWAAYYASAVILDSQTIGAAVFSENVQDLVDKAGLIRNQFLLIFAGATVVIFGLSYVSTNHISRPLAQLRESAMEITKGNFTTRVHIKGKNEIAELGKVFNSMSAKLENLDQQRSEFVSNASHELKTPLASIKILTESLLYQDNIPENVYKEFLGDINQEIDRLTNLINDLLLMTKIENDKEKMDRQQVSIDLLLKKAVVSLKPLADQKDIELSFTWNQNTVITCDPMRIRQAVNNLIDNAVKYTPAGGRVDVGLEVHGEEVAIVVKDTGEGISKEDQAHIFDRFYRVDKARSRETGGTGLGLYIVQCIALLHEGRVEIESEKGQGSTFRLFLPIAGPSAGQDTGAKEEKKA